MSIPALPSSTAALGQSANTARPAFEARPVVESRTGAMPAIGAGSDPGQVDQVRKPAEADKAEQAARKQELEEAAAKLNQKLKPFLQEAVHFRVDQDSGKLVVAMVDTEKNTVLRQFPSAEALKMSREADSRNKPSGLLLNTRA